MSNEIKAGDPIPDIELTEGNPDTKVKLSELLANGSGIILGTPAAFSPACSDTHIPGYIAHEKAKQAGQIFVVSVNDPFVMKAWGKSLDADGSSGIRFIADAAGKFTKAIGTDFDATPVLGNHRSKRYALVTENGKIKSVHIEPEKFPVDVSSAEKVLGN